MENDMKEIKASIRQDRVADVLEALRDSGLCNCAGNSACHNITASRVQHPFAGTDTAQQHYAMDLAEPVVIEYKLELLCSDDLVDTLVDVIVKAAHTGQPDPGWILVAAIERAIKIA